MELATITL